MIIKNSVSISIDEAVELLNKIAKSLEKEREFSFDLKGQEISIEASEELIAQLSIKPEEFSIVFNWEPQKQEIPVETPTAPPQEQSQQIPVPKQSPQATAEKPKKIKPKISKTKRTLPDRMVLSTTTLPLDAGYWAPAFTENGDSQWTEITIEGDLENTKWASEEQLTTLSDLTPRQAKPKKSRTSRNVSDDDLFSELDAMDQKTSSRPKTRKRPPTHKKEVAAPAARVNEIPHPTSSPVQKPPETQESGKEKDWVKPSEFIKSEDQSEKTPQPQGIPQPKQHTSQSLSSPDKSDIPAPPSQSIPTPPSQPSTPLTEEEQEIADWKEPVDDDNDEDWVKPSEVLKAKKKGEEDEKDMTEKIERPPPKAPDSEEEKKKGWASWD